MNYFRLPLTWIAQSDRVGGRPIAIGRSAARGDGKAGITTSLSGDN
jgi:hypothetical protein